jgi:hypothetical protein
LAETGDTVRHWLGMASHRLQVEIANLVLFLQAVQEMASAQGNAVLHFRKRNRPQG